MSLDKLNEATGRAVQAAELLRNPLLAESFKALEEAFMGRWRETKPGDVEAREKLFLAINVVGKVQEFLMHAIANGKLAQAELNKLAEAAEREKKGWLRR